MQHTVRSFTAQTQEGLGQRDSQDISRLTPHGSASKSLIMEFPKLSNSCSQTPLVRHLPSVHNSPLSHPPSLLGQPQPPHRQPSLSLNTTNLTDSTQPSTLNPSSPPSTVFSESLDSLRIGLDSVWQQSSKILHGFYQTTTQQSEKIRALTTNNIELQGVVTRQRVMLQDIEHQMVQQTRIQSENQEQTNNKVAWKQTKLKTTYTRLWDNIMKLEGEKKELTAKIGSQAEFTRLCLLQLQEERDKIVKKANNNPENIKMEEDEDVGVDAAGNSILISLSDVEQRIATRLHAQAIEHTLELNSLRKLLADYQLRTTDLEAQLHSIENSKVQRSSPSGSPSSDNRQPHKHQSPGDTNAAASASRSGLGGIPPMASPITPQTSLSSATPERQSDHLCNSLEGWKPTDNRSEPNGNYEAPPTNRRVSGPADVEILQQKISTPVMDSLSSNTDSIPVQKSARGAAPEKLAEMPPPPPPSYRQLPSAYCGPATGWRPVVAFNSLSQRRSHPSTAQVTNVNSQPLSPSHRSQQQSTQQIFRQLPSRPRSSTTPSPRFRPQPYSSVHPEGQIHPQSQPTPQSHQNTQEVMRPKNTHLRSPGTSNGVERPKKRFRVRSSSSLDTNQRPPPKQQTSFTTDEIRTSEYQNFLQPQPKTGSSQPVFKSNHMQAPPSPPTPVHALQLAPLSCSRSPTGTTNGPYLGKYKLPLRQNPTAPQPNQSPTGSRLSESSQSHGKSENQTVHQMTWDEQVMFSSLNRVLVRKKEGESWRCALCKLENPQATFGEDTPIEGVTKHVKHLHKEFWKEIKQRSPLARHPSPQRDPHPG